MLDEETSILDMTQCECWLSEFVECECE